jgi:ubiquinone/menaquinone biosynthesis C-methylase UbiE
MLDGYLDGGPMASSWQRLKWTLKYRFGRPGHVPAFDTLLNRPHRTILLDRLDGLGPWRSLLEVGCGRGVNLLLTAKRKPDAKLTGIDTSVAAIRTTRVELARRGMKDFHLEVGSVSNLTGLADQSFDVVLADAVLMYVPPAEIVDALSEMLRVARFGIVAGVWNSDIPPPASAWLYDEGTWVYDYRRILGGLGCINADVESYPEGVWDDGRWQKYGSILLIGRNANSGRGQP